MDFFDLRGRFAEHSPRRTCSFIKIADFRIDARAPTRRLNGQSATRVPCH